LVDDPQLTDDDPNDWEDVFEEPSVSGLEDAVTE